MKAAIVEISSPFLLDLLQLPASAEVVSFEYHMETHTWRLRIHGVGYEVPDMPSFAVPRVTGTVKRDGDATRITWPFDARGQLVPRGT